MANKKQYYGLDDIGFIGTQNRTKAQIKKDIASLVWAFYQNLFPWSRDKEE
jgi:hypothetical protein